MGSVPWVSYGSHLPMQVARWPGRALQNVLPAWGGACHASPSKGGSMGLGGGQHSHPSLEPLVLATSSRGHLAQHGPSCPRYLRSKLPQGRAVPPLPTPAAGGLKQVPTPRPAHLRASRGSFGKAVPSAAPLRERKGLISMQNRKPAAQEASMSAVRQVRGSRSGQRAGTGRGQGTHQGRSES